MATLKQSDAVSVTKAADQLPGLAAAADDDTLRRAVRVEDEGGVPQLAVVPWDLFETLRALATLLQDPAWQAKSPSAVLGLLTHLKYKYDLSAYGPNPSQAGSQRSDRNAGVRETPHQVRERKGTIYYSDEEFLNALRERRPDVADL